MCLLSIKDSNIAPKETKKEYLTKFLLHYRKRFNEEEEGLKMHEQYKQTVAKVSTHPVVFLTF